VNDEQEAQLRYALEAAVAMPHEKLCARVLELEAENRDRRSWVWADLGYSMMAHALEPLARLATLARYALGGVSLAAMAADYATEGWRCDRAALDAMNHAKSPSDNALVAKVVRALYAPWLDKSARRFQELATQNEAEYRRLVFGCRGRARDLPGVRRRPAIRCRRHASGAVGATGTESEARASPRAVAHGHRHRQADRLAGSCGV
jgi:hypothetical protein